MRLDDTSSPSTEQEQTAQEWTRRVLEHLRQSRPEILLFAPLKPTDGRNISTAGGE
jgi:hypothetical protein